MKVKYYLDTLVGGAGPGNRGADFAVFRSREAGGSFSLYTYNWIKRGRPTEIEIDIPEEV